MEGTDVMKALIFTHNKSYWMPISVKVEAWVKGGWAKWEEEKPDWFTDQWKVSVPEDMKPQKGKGSVDGGDMAAEIEGDRALIVGGGDEQKGRRRSVLELISGQKAASSKVMPAGEIKKEEIDMEEFVRAMKRRESLNM